MRRQTSAGISPLLIVFSVNPLLLQCSVEALLRLGQRSGFHREGQSYHRLGNLLPSLECDLLFQVHVAIGHGHTELVRPQDRRLQLPREFPFIHSEQGRQGVRHLHVLAAHKLRVREHLFHRHADRQRVPVRVQNLAPPRLPQKHLLALRHGAVLVVIAHLQHHQARAQSRERDAQQPGQDHQPALVSIPFHGHP